MEQSGSQLTISKPPSSQFMFDPSARLVLCLVECPSSRCPVYASPVAHLRYTFALLTFAQDLGCEGLCTKHKNCDSDAPRVPPRIKTLGTNSRVLAGPRWDLSKHFQRVAFPRSSSLHPSISPSSKSLQALPRRRARRIRTPAVSVGRLATFSLPLSSIVSTRNLVPFPRSGLSRSPSPCACATAAGLEHV